MRAAIREGRFVTTKESVRNLRAQLLGHVHTTTRRRLSSLPGPAGLYLDGLLKGADTRGRPSDLFYAVRVEDGAVGAAKVFYTPAPLPGAGPGAASAGAEWRVSQQLDAVAPTAGAELRQHVVRYSSRFELGSGREALFMPLYVRSLQQLVEEAHVAVPLPVRCLLRTARDVLRGLALLHAAELSHCDVKADNIMFSADGTATLIDLGAAAKFGAEVVEGMPPEMALDADIIHGNATADLVGLACTLWWALHRTLPVSGTTRLSLAARADALIVAGESSAPQVHSVIAHILRAESAQAALAATDAILLA